MSPIIGSSSKVMVSNMVQNTPEPILHDMNVLRQNWNDLVEEEQRNEEFLRSIRKEQPQSAAEKEFEPVLSKSQKKRIRQKKKQAQTDLPLTRARAGSLNLAK